MDIKKALINYAKWKKELSEVNKKIGNELYLSEECVTSEMRADKKLPFNASYWLHMAYEMGSDCQDEYGPYDRYFINHDNDVEGFLKQHCKHALNAHLLIQERKLIKKRLGIAKAVLSRMANKLLESENE